MTPFRITAILLIAACVLAAGCISPGQDSSPKGLATNATIPGKPTDSIPEMSESSVGTVIPSVLLPDNHPLLEIPGRTTLIAANVTAVADLERRGVRDPGAITIPVKVTRYDLVTFDIPAIRDQLETGRGLPIRIRGKDYLADVSLSRPRTTDDGIDTYTGVLAHEACSDVTLFSGPGQFAGTIILNGEHIGIESAENEVRAGYSSPRHYIYSMRDVRPQPARLCGGGFEAYVFAENVTPRGTAIVLTEKDFQDFPELGAVIRGENHTKSVCDQGNALYPYCVGGGRFSCEEECMIGRYADSTDWRNTTVFGTGITNYVVYNGKNYYLKITWRS